MMLVGMFESTSLCESEHYNIHVCIGMIQYVTIVNE